MTDDPLSELLLDSVQVDRTRLAKALKDLLGIDMNTGAIVPKPGFGKLGAREKLVAFLLGVKASSLLRTGDPESVPAKNIPQQLGLPEGTVRPRLRELLEQRVISQSETGEYYIASHQIYGAIQQIEWDDAEDVVVNNLVGEKRDAEISDWLSSVLSNLPPDHLIAENGSYDQKITWAVIRLFKDGQPAVNETIRDHIRLNLSISPPSRQNTNRSLRRLVPKYLSREPSGQGRSLTYFPKPEVLKLFKNLLDTKP
jgi:hypothetical protein